MEWNKIQSRRFYMVLFWVCTATVAFARDQTVWMMEVLPAYLGFIAIFVLLDRNVVLSPLLNIVIAVHVLVLTIGGIFTYPKVPFFNPTDWLGELMGWQRNNYDKLGHFMQGFTPYIATKEMLIRRNIVGRSTMQVFLCISVSMAVSAIYELIEYLTIMMSSEIAVDFVGAQGDPYDTQTDMLFALLGAIFAACALVNYRYKDEKKDEKE